MGPLWADIKRVATAVIEADGDLEVLERVGAHFLGAVVLKELSHHAGDVARSAVIDGQQRMTTLQIVLDAAHSVVDELERGRGGISPRPHREHGEEVQRNEGALQAGE